MTGCISSPAHHASMRKKKLAECFLMSACMHPQKVNQGAGKDARKEAAKDNKERLKSYWWAGHVHFSLQSVITLRPLILITVPHPAACCTIPSPLNNRQPPCIRL